MSLLLTLDRFHTLLWCFDCLLWTSKCRVGNCFQWGLVSHIVKPWYWTKSKLKNDSSKCYGRKAFHIFSSMSGAVCQPAQYDAVCLINNPAICKMNRNSRQQMFFKMDVLKNFAYFTGKHLFSQNTYSGCFWMYFSKS